MVSQLERIYDDAEATSDQADPTATSSCRQRRRARRRGRALPPRPGQELSSCRPDGAIRRSGQPGDLRSAHGRLPSAAMKVDGGIAHGLTSAGAPGRRARGGRVLRGVDGGDQPRSVPPAAAGGRAHGRRSSSGTSIAVAFARNPMTLANLAWDLQAFSGGRFVLGLGSQIKPHIKKRFSMPWSHPAARMREMIQAIRAIWATLARRRAARVPRRVLHAHADDAVLHARRRPTSTASASRRSSSPASAS